MHSEKSFAIFIQFKRKLTEPRSNVCRPHFNQGRPMIQYWEGQKEKRKLRELSNSFCLICLCRMPKKHCPESRVLNELDC